MTTTVHTYEDCGPYFDPCVMKYRANNLTDLLRHVRIAMDDCVDSIAVFRDGNLIGAWDAQGDAEPDGEGGMYPVFCGYERVKPKSFCWNQILNLFPDVRN